MKKIFSIPFNPYIDEEFFENNFVPFIQKNKDTIFDVYSTLHIPPFMIDSMGGIFTDTDSLIQNFFSIQDEFGVLFTGTFNNITVSPDISNLNLFIDHLKPLYEYGLRSIIVPHQHWMRLGYLQKEFPEMLFKNTIVSKLYDLQDVYEAAIAGFDYIHLDRNVMRDKDLLEKLPKLRETIKERSDKDIIFSLLVNESCIGRCPVMNEHYVFNNTRTGEIKPYFTNKISTVACPKWKNEDKAYYLKIANVVPLKSQFDYYLKYVDVLKLHGRDDINVFQDSMNIVDNYNNGKENLFPSHISHYMARLGNQYEYFINNKSKNCKFQCWECSWCDDNCLSVKG